MKPTTIVSTLVLLLLGAGIALAADANMGTWKLNNANSNLGPGAPKNMMVVYEQTSDGNVKVTVKSVANDGSSTRNEWTGRFDGNYYPVSGDPNHDARSYKKINAYTLELSAKKNGRVTTTGRIILAKDGKSRTVTIQGTNAQGERFTSVAVYEKQ